jgi:hypothetical protein
VKQALHQPHVIPSHVQSLLAAQFELWISLIVALDCQGDRSKVLGFKCYSEQLQGSRRLRQGGQEPATKIVYKEDIRFFGQF